MALERIKEILSIGLSRNYDRDVSAEKYEKRISERRKLLAGSICEKISEFCPAIAMDGSPARVLELAAGTGIITRVLDEKKFQVTGLDYSINMLANLNERFPDLPLVQANMNKPLPFRDNTFDGTTLVWANRYLDGENLSNFVSEIRRVIKPGGVFVWPVFPVEGILWDLRMFPGQLKPYLRQFSDVKTISPPISMEGQPPFHAPGYVIATK